MNVQLVPELVLKVTNIIGREVVKISREEYDEMNSDVRNNFEKYGNVINLYVVCRRSYEKLGAELGSIFIEYDDIKYAEMAYYAMKEKEYSGKKLNICFFPKEIFYSEILPDYKKSSHQKIDVKELN